ncbi:MAG: hypothetical protein PHX51_06100 [Clostridia bacterium]|nr:hypothetical protein [Clostridia bacterium]
MNNGLSPSEIAEYMKKLTAYYSNQDDDKLLTDIIETVNNQKAQGKLNDESILNMTNTLRRFLNEDQKERLDRLLEKILTPKIG